MLEEKRIKSVIPYYSVGVVFLMASLVMPMYRIENIFTAVVLSLFVAMMVYKMVPDKVIQVEKAVAPTGDEIADKVMVAFNDLLKALKASRPTIAGSKIEKDVHGIFSTTLKIQNFLEKNTNKARNARSFTDYYVPTTITLVESYGELLAKDQDTANIASSKTNIEDALSSLVVAYTKQLDALFEDKALDISAEVKLLNTLLEREGLK